MASKKYDYVLTESAQEDIDNAFFHIVSDFSHPKAATVFADEFEEQLAIICKSPKIGRIVENDCLKRDDVRRFLVKNYIAYYIIDEKNTTIFVLRVVYNKRNQDNIVKDF